MILIIRGDNTSLRSASTFGSCWRRKRSPLTYRNAVLHREPRSRCRLRGFPKDLKEWSVKGRERIVAGGELSLHTERSRVGSLRPERPAICVGAPLQRVRPPPRATSVSGATRRRSPPPSGRQVSH